jgi:hypothetical protein
MSEQTTPESVGGAKTRPTLLTVMCIISWVFQGILAVLLLLGAVGAAALSAGAAYAEANGGSVTGTGNIWMAVGIGILLLVVGFIGVLKMWKLKKQGFFLYVGAGVAGVIVDLTMGAGLNIFSLLVTAVFILLYGLNLKHME